MTFKQYRGSCHCGAVRYEVDLDLSRGTNRCNCSICTKARAWFTFVKPEQFHLLSGEDAQTEYQWTPPGRPGPSLHYRFCRTCGIRTFASGDAEFMDGKFYALSVASLDDVNSAELGAAPMRFVDGRHDRFDQAPTDTSLL
jgi:hypothetical protein